MSYTRIVITTEGAARAVTESAATGSVWTSPGAPRAAVRATSSVHITRNAAAVFAWTLTLQIPSTAELVGMFVLTVCLVCSVCVGTAVVALFHEFRLRHPRMRVTKYCFN